MSKGFMIRSSAFKHQPIDTKKEKDTEKDKEKTDINSKCYVTIRKLVKLIDKAIKSIQ